MKWHNVQFANQGIAQTVYDEMIDAGIRVDDIHGVWQLDRYYVVSYMPMTRKQVEDAYAIVDKHIVEDLHV